MRHVDIPESQRAPARSQSAETATQIPLKELAYRFTVGRGYVLYLIRVGQNFRLYGREQTPKKLGELKFVKGKYPMDLQIALSRAADQAAVEAAFDAHVETEWERI